MCNCKSQLETQFIQQFQLQNPHAMQVEASMDDNYAISVLRPELVGFIAMQGTYHEQSKKGKTIKRRIHTPICFSYCPFCGEEID